MRGDELIRSGKVGTGCENEHRACSRARHHRQAQCAVRQGTAAERLSRGARWVQPVVYVDIAYRGRTGDGMLRHPRSKVSLAFSEARAGELEERVGYLVLGPAGFRCALSQFLHGRFQGELALKAALRMVGRAAWFHDRNA
ncbi:MAG: hypothetical protein EOR69_31695 [Mesorhizobium sp.]|nr:MAG: hypothetical protein EOR69_31695 [Mesorhizobium sp.]RWL92390.1 MAG: hypothetical protein EOR70_31685 [Mesorhizobium sp.]